MPLSLRKRYIALRNGIIIDESDNKTELLSRIRAIKSSKDEFTYITENTPQRISVDIPSLDFQF